jgi:Tfp pilus assembly protein FimT
MKRKIRRVQNQKGISITELLIVLTITAILVAFSVAQFGNAADIFETQNAARELKVNLERARFDSVKRRPSTTADMSSVTIENATKLTVKIDLDQNGVIDANDSREIEFSFSGEARIVSETLSFPVTVSFDRRGKAIAVDSIGNVVDPYFIVCNNCTYATLASSEAYVVDVSATGTLAMYVNGEIPGTLIDPTVTTITGTDDVDPMITIAAGGAAPAGTPAPTPTPDPTPTITPTPIPTATPTPTATPELVFCVRRERPAVTGCICSAPMRVRGNGQCI